MPFPAKTRRTAPPSIGTTKRLLEIYTAGEDLQQALHTDPTGTLARFHLDIDPEDVRPLYDGEHALRLAREGTPVSAAVTAYRNFIQGKLDWRDRLREECAPVHPLFRAWRERQMGRCLLQLGPELQQQLIHTPAVWEIAQGCSVGCWFCGFNAPPLSNLFRHTEHNALLWRDCLHQLQQITGPAGRHAVLYWATEPLDNPDYEAFCLDFADAFGKFPQTTTAVPLRDVERTRRLLRLSSANGVRVNRFSILSRTQLLDVYAAFTPDELTDVELIIQDGRADLVKADTGRFHSLEAKKGLLLEKEKDKFMKEILSRSHEDKRIPTRQELRLPGTIACVTGFLINMCERSVQLISPCPADERWPLGYMIFDQGRFETAVELGKVLHTMIERNMPATPPKTETLQFLPDLKYEALENGFRVSTYFGNVTLEQPQLAAYLRDTGSHLQAGNKTADDIALLAMFRHQVPDSFTKQLLSGLFQKGLFGTHTIPYSGGPHHA